MKIVITGSLGNIGKPLVQALIGKGHSATVISSNSTRQHEIAALGAMAAHGSLTDADFLADCFTGADAVYCMVPPAYDEPDQQVYYQRMGENYKKAILRTGVKRVVHLSSYGAHLSSGTGFIAGSYQVEQILNSIAGVQLTHLRPTSFYYNLLAFIPMIKAAGFIGAVYGGKDQLALVAPTDIAKSAAEELLTTANVVSVRYVGSDDRSCDEIAAIIGAAIGRPTLQWLVLSKEEVYAALLKNGLSGEYAKNLVELGDAIHSGKLREEYDLHRPVLGSVKLEAYAHEFAQQFINK